MFRQSLISVVLAELAIVICHVGVGSAIAHSLDGNNSQVIVRVPWALPWADEYDDELDVTHGVDERNRLSGIVRADESTNIDDDHEPVYDGAGNLVFDGDYWYQYDGWNRLVQVNEAWRDTQEPFDVVVGDLVKHHSYDGLGRLVRTQSPVLGPTALRTERFHYDGVRRIQEVVTDPVASPGGALMSGDPELEALALSTVEPGTDEQAAPLAFEQGQVEMMSGGGGPGGGGPGGGGIQPPRIDREYIWGPGDNGLDELLVQYDRYGDEWWAITDAGGDLVALCDLLGEGEYDDVARVVAQWTYDAYGAVLTAEHLDGYTLDAAPHLGHKGLFLDRLDANVTQPRLVPFAHALYHARNRVYSPQHGRWNQQDPNQTAINLLEASVHHGRGVAAIVMAFDVEGIYGDGGNLYEYLGSNPWMRFDPMGLSWDPFDMVDEYLAEDAASKAAFMEQVIGGFDAMLHIGLQIAQLHPGINMAVTAVQLASGQISLGQAAVNLVPGRVLAKSLGALHASRRAYASRREAGHSAVDTRCHLCRAPTGAGIVSLRNCIAAATDTMDPLEVEVVESTDTPKQGIR